MIKVICKKNYYVNFQKIFTKNKLYYMDSPYSDIQVYYSVKNKDYITFRQDFRKYFLHISEHRDKQINEILNGD